MLWKLSWNRSNNWAERRIYGLWPAVILLLRGGSESTWRRLVKGCWWFLICPARISLMAPLKEEFIRSRAHPARTWSHNGSTRGCGEHQCRAFGCPECWAVIQSMRVLIVGCGYVGLPLGAELV